MEEVVARTKGGRQQRRYALIDVGRAAHVACSCFAASIQPGQRWADNPACPNLSQILATALTSTTIAPQLVFRAGLTRQYLLPMPSGRQKYEEPSFRPAIDPHSAVRVLHAGLSTCCSC